jgi:hypothetical protein
MPGDATTMNENRCVPDQGSRRYKGAPKAESVEAAEICLMRHWILLAHPNPFESYDDLVPSAVHS